MILSKGHYGARFGILLTRLEYTEQPFPASTQGDGISYVCALPHLRVEWQLSVVCLLRGSGPFEGDQVRTSVRSRQFLLPFMCGQIRKPEAAP
jgi:hypothetical protein